MKKHTSYTDTDLRRTRLNRRSFFKTCPTSTASERKEGRGEDFALDNDDDETEDDVIVDGVGQMPRVFT